MMFGGVVGAINPKNFICKVVGYVLVFSGVINGIGYSIKLNTIHRVVRSDNPFGVQGCSTEPAFPFGLPLDKWSPDWFKPTGECGFDYPIVPDDVTLNGLQRWLVDFYADGWYLWPASHLINMAQACLVIFGAILLIFAVAALSWLITLIRAKIFSLSTLASH
jgi:disulfide bond formation protein DsbB